jgi:pimeloyl-ACP methyl ester carboxylesterase
VDVIRFDPPGVGGSAPPTGPYRFTGLCALIAGMLTELGYGQVDVLVRAVGVDRRRTTVPLSEGWRS